MSAGGRSLLSQRSSRISRPNSDHRYGLLIPSALHTITQTVPLKPQDLFLKIKGRRHDTLTALFIDLEGTLDHLNAQELLNRIKDAAEKGQTGHCRQL